VLPISPTLAAKVSQRGEPVQLKLVTTVWKPQMLLGTSDNRDLGVMIDRVAVR
jgi:hypothetical protein